MVSKNANSYHRTTPLDFRTKGEAAKALCGHEKTCSTDAVQPFSDRDESGLKWREVADVSSFARHAVALPCPRARLCGDGHGRWCKFAFLVTARRNRWCCGCRMTGQGRRRAGGRGSTAVELLGRGGWRHRNWKNAGHTPTGRRFHPCLVHQRKSVLRGLSRSTGREHDRGVELRSTVS